MMTSVLVWSLMMLLNIQWTRVNCVRDGQSLIRRRLLLRPGDTAGNNREHNTARFIRFHNNTSSTSGLKTHVTPASARRRSLVKKKIKKIIKSKSRKNGEQPASVLRNHNTPASSIDQFNMPANTLDSFNR